MSEKASFRDNHGVEVWYRRWRPDGEARAIVLVAHGASDHSGRYERLARVLAAEGYAVYAIDHRGHGATATSTGPGRLGPGGMDAVVDDLRELHDRASTDCGDLPVVVLGHSMGAAVGLLCAERHAGVAGLVLSGATGPIEDAAEIVAGLRAAVEAGIGDDPLDAFGAHNASFEPARTRFDWLSRDEAEVDAYIADPLCGDDLPLTYGFSAELVDAMDAATDPVALARLPGKLPVLMLTGEQDATSNFAQQARELEARLRAAGADVTATYYPGARHDLFSEVNRDEVHADLVAWMAALVEALAYGRTGRPL